MNDRPRQARFESTRWSVVLAAGVEASSEAAAALEALCQTYWPPIYAFVRREGFQEAEAQDLTQSFFAMLLERNDLRTVDPRKGRFRSFLLAALKHFLINQGKKQRARKRGGSRVVLSLDFATAESAFSLEPPDRATPEAVFNRQWALTLLAEVQAKLQDATQAGGRGELYAALKPHLAGDPDAGKYADIASQLGMTEAAVKMAMSRLRKKYRELLRTEIAQTVAGDDDEVDNEIRELFDALRGPRS